MKTTTLIMTLAALFAVQDAQAWIHYESEEAEKQDALEKVRELNEMAATGNKGDWFKLIGDERPCAVCDEKGRTPVMMATFNIKEPAMLTHFLRTTHALHHQDNEGRTALHYAVMNKNHAAVQTLMDFGAVDFIGAEDNAGNTPLHLALVEQDFLMVGLMLDRVEMEPHNPEAVRMQDAIEALWVLLAINDTAPDTPEALAAVRSHLSALKQLRDTVEPGCPCLIPPLVIVRAGEPSLLYQAEVLDTALRKFLYTPGTNPGLQEIIRTEAVLDLPLRDVGLWSIFKKGGRK